MLYLHKHVYLVQLPTMFTLERVILTIAMFLYVSNVSPCEISAYYFFQKRNCDVYSSSIQVTWCENLVTCRYPGVAMFTVEALLYFVPN
jgi:hypothetical protein